MSNVLAAPLTTEPVQVVAGDTVRWRRDDLSSLYPASDYYTLTYHFQAAGGAVVSIDATSDVEGWLVTLSAVGWAAGPRAWAAMVSHPDYGRRQVDAGKLTVKPDPTVADAAFDPRSHARKVLDAIEAVIERRATKTHEETTLSDGRSVKSIPHAELLRLRSHYASLVAAEDRQADQARGIRRGGGMLKVRM